MPVLLGRLQLPARPPVSGRPDPAARRTGRAPYANRVGLVSIALCDHPEIERILTPAHRDGLRHQSRVAAAGRSHRADRSAAARRAANGRITIAPETGSDRLRRVINKTVTNDEILDRADLIFSSGIENLKLYYMIGLPTETDEDLDSHSRPDAPDTRPDDEARPIPWPGRPHRRQREPAYPEARDGVPVAADGRPGADRREDQAPPRS